MHAIINRLFALNNGKVNGSFEYVPVDSMETVNSTLNFTEFRCLRSYYA
jgi:hypothetical protein